MLNEIDGLKATLPHIDRDLFDEVLIVDGGSTDGSVEYARSLGFRVIRQKRPGLAWAVYDAICDLQTDYIIEFSPDGNCPVEALPELVRQLHQGHDLVVVSRYLWPARSQDDNLLTAFGNWMFTRLIRGLGRFPITDALTIYRGFRRDIVFRYDFRRYLAGPVFEPLVSGICTLHGLKICEIPGDEPRRIGGRSKMRPLYNGSCILLMVARLYLRKLFGLRI
ncbi:MAG TPA: glycosyltransferase family 2 protein [Gemmataceae bacterium]|nr:glycosyltransferase family 2 protein [Gemmataceae bacterium]